MAEILTGIDGLVIQQERIGFGQGNQTLSAETYKDNYLFLLTGVAQAGLSLFMPPEVESSAVFEASSTNLFPLALTLGSRSFSLLPGETYSVLTDATPNGLAVGQIGGGGTMSTWEPKNQSFTAVAGGMYDLTGLSGPITATLPDDPSDYDEVSFSNLDGSVSSGHVVTIDGNGHPISGDYVVGDSTMPLSTPYAAFKLRFFDTAWRLV
jgi:hypothetical protein